VFCVITCPKFIKTVSRKRRYVLEQIIYNGTTLHLHGQCSRKGLYSFVLASMMRSNPLASTPQWSYPYMSWHPLCVWIFFPQKNVLVKILFVRNCFFCRGERCIRDIYWTATLLHLHFRVLLGWVFIAKAAGCCKPIILIFGTSICLANLACSGLQVCSIGEQFGRIGNRRYMFGRKHLSKEVHVH
jgi:hypothetical protein